MAAVLYAVIMVLASPVYFDEIVAVVGGTPILFSDVRDKVAQNLGPRFSQLCAARRYRYPALMLQQAWSEALMFLMDETLLREEARRRKITVTGDDVQEYLRTLASASGKGVEEFLASMEKAGLSRRRVFAIVRMRLLQQRLMASRIASMTATEREVRALKDWLVQKEAFPYAVGELDFVPKGTKSGRMHVTGRIYPYSVPARLWTRMVSAGPWSGPITLDTPEGRYTVTIKELHLHPAAQQRVSVEELRNRILQWRMEHAMRRWLATLAQKYPREVFRPVPDLDLLCLGR